MAEFARRASPLCRAHCARRYAVHNAGVSLTLKKAGDPSPVVRTSSSNTTVDNIRAIYGSAIAKELIKVGDGLAQKGVHD